MNSSLCKSNNQIAAKSFCPIFDALIVSYYISAIAAVKKKKSEMNFKSSIRPSHPISEIMNFHVCSLKRPETRAIKNQMFFKSRKLVYIVCKVVDWLQWGRRSWNIPKVGPAHPYFMLSSIFENIMFWFIEIDLKSVYFFLFFFDMI